MATETILIIEDEEDIRELIKLALKSAGFSRFIEAADGEKGLRLAAEKHPELILLDLMLPGIEGLDVCRKLKKMPETQSIPILMLTAKSEESDIVLGLEMGAADYITKPFSNKVLAARVRAQLRSAVSKTEDTKIINLGDLVINEEEHSVELGKTEISLTRSEFDILHLFAKKPGRVYTRNQVINAIKGDDYPVTDRAIDVQIVNLRRKLGNWGVNIETVRGVGYKLKTGFIQ